MAARVLLLITFTGLFGAAWNSDQPEAAEMRLAKKSEHLPERPSSSQDAGHSLMMAEVGRAVAVTSELDLSNVLLPQGISSGTYRIVDQQGRVGWLTIGIDRQDSSPAADLQPVYTSQSERSRWYFIRVIAAPTIASPLAETAILR